MRQAAIVAYVIAAAFVLWFVALSCYVGPKELMNILQ